MTAISVKTGSALVMMKTLFPNPLARSQTVDLAANTRFGNEWAKAVAGWGTDQEGRLTAAQELMEAGILLPFNGGAFTLEHQFEIDQVRERLELAPEMAADFLQIITDSYSHVMQNAGKEANALCLELQVESQSVSDHIEAAFTEPTSIAINIDSEGPDIMEEVAETIEVAEPIRIAEEGVGVDTEPTTFSEEPEAQATEAEPTLDTSDWDRVLSQLEVQDETQLASDTLPSGETIGVETSDVLDVTSVAGQEIASENTGTDELSLDSPISVDRTIAVIQEYETALLEIFRSPIEVTTIGEARLELQDASTHDFEARIQKLGGQPSTKLYLAVNARITSLRELIIDLEEVEAQDKARAEAAAWEAELAAEEAERIAKVAKAETLQLKPMSEVIKTESKAETKVVQMPIAATPALELNVNGKYTSGKQQATQTKDMTTRQSVMAAKKAYKASGGKSKTLKGMSKVVNAAVRKDKAYELAKLTTCKVGESINVFPSNMLVNEHVKAKGGKPEINQVRMGTAYFSKQEKDGPQAYGLGLHWKNLPTLEKETVADFVWPTAAIHLKFEREIKRKNGKGETVSSDWNKEEIDIPCPLILGAEFGHATQTKSGKMPSTFLKSDNPVCYRPTLTVASVNNLLRMANLGFTYLGTVEIPKGSAYWKYLITGMKVHVFLDSRQKGRHLNDLIEEGVLTNY